MDLPERSIMCIGAPYRLAMPFNIHKNHAGIEIYMAVNHQKRTVLLKCSRQISANRNMPGMYLMSDDIIRFYGH